MEYGCAQAECGCEQCCECRKTRHEMLLYVESEWPRKTQSLRLTCPEGKLTRTKGGQSSRKNGIAELANKRLVVGDVVQ